MRALTLCLAILALALSTPARAENAAPSDGMVTVATGKPFARFAEAMAMAETIAGNGFNTIGIACADCGIKKAFGETVAGNRVFLFFRPDYARRMLAASVAAGIEAPIRVYATEAADGTATVTYRRPSAVFGAYRVPDLAAMGRELDDHVARIVADAATKS